MRADRLVAILLMLQSHGRVTAAEVADELEVSERTARRDLEALGMAGLPVYSTQGRNGGWRLLGGGRTDLSGLTAAEARALFLVAGPAAATPAMKAAVRKLVRALPETLRTQAEATTTSVVIDPAGWEQPPVAAHHAPPHLDAVQRAVVEGEQLELGYVARDRTATTRVVHPLGLATKGTIWYLVADTDAGLRTFRVDRIRAVTPTGDAVVTPPNFELRAAWRMITEEVDRKRAPVHARAYVEPQAVGWLRASLGNRVRIGPARADKRVELELRGHHEHSLAAELAGYGTLVEVVEPHGVRAQLARIATELTLMYGTAIGASAAAARVSGTGA